ncbi:Alpha/beta hydrolase fold-1 [Penicillium concentricum]|uniref:Alpha/beta hydrolase fold-1 n=1 Tax=Penicillium concentricum TaxID=293559 RepID=A0A9W9SQ82_9EURO|nr:Alpha/beta hydrolase fold-1 [Penicillium concentricum]KAJ5382487.1 Alpha/beta hydrolase fold-1 [Penicillium concentricum]
MEEKLLPGIVTRKRERRYPYLKNWALPSIWTLLALLILCNQYNLYPRSYPCRSPKPLTYIGEHITWEPCGDLHGKSLECSSIEVPIDQFATEKQNPTNSKNFTIPLIRLRSENATQNLLLNPGGPGGSGFEFLYRRGNQLQTILGSGFHLLTFDPRGVNSSTPAASCYPDAKTRQEQSHIRARDAAADSPEIYAWAQNFAKACPETMGDYAPYINTPQTAADMNSILDAVGQQDMIYWGFSYGTLLGQTYAGLFPERSKRVVIDGVVDQFVWYEGVSDSDEFIDTDKVLDGFFDECIKAEAGSCALASLATSKEELSEIVLSFMDKIRHQPIDVYINNTVYGILTYEKVWYNGVFTALYKPPLWSSLAQNLYSLIQGNATTAFLAYNIGDELNDESNEFVTLNDGLTGPSHWPQSKDALLAQITPWLNQSLFSTSFLTSFYQKQQWTVPRTHPYVPRHGVETAHPLLIMSTTYDPVCPLVSARVANEAFAGSRVVEVEGYGHCSVAVGSVCAAKHVRAFLYEGKLPDGYTRCKVDSAYFVSPDENGHMAAQTYFEDPEDQNVHLAQLELMAGWEFARPMMW